VAFILTMFSSKTPVVGRASRPKGGGLPKNSGLSSPRSRNDPFYKNLSIFSLIAIGTLCSSCISHPQPDFNPPQQNLKILTYNINFIMAEPQAIANYINESDADIICLQETHPRWEIFLKAHTEKIYPYARFNTAGGAGGLAIISKYPIGHTSYIPPKSGWFPAMQSELITNLGLIHIMNIHLQPPLSDKGKLTPWSYLKSSRNHKKDLSHFISRTDPSRPHIIMGDFNEDNLRLKGFNDALSIYDSKSYTWSGTPIPPLVIKKRLDHILFNKHFKCTGAKVADISASDHRPVIAVLTGSTKPQKTVVK